MNKESRMALIDEMILAEDKETYKKNLMKLCPKAPMELVEEIAEDVTSVNRSSKTETEMHSDER
jgi:hypothetical protein